MKTETHVTIDMETLGLKPGAAILEIAAATFDPGGTAEAAAFAVEIDLLSSIPAGMTADAATAAWHLEKGYAGHLRGKPLAVAVMGLHVWLREQAPGAIVWAWGMDFERPLLEAACAAVGMDLPWHYTLGRDARTVWNTVYPCAKPAPRTHRAAADVAAQISDLQKALKGVAA